jgi:hypothetical protein
VRIIDDKALGLPQAVQVSQEAKNAGARQQISHLLPRTRAGMRDGAPTESIDRDFHVPLEINENMNITAIQSKKCCFFWSSSFIGIGGEISAEQIPRRSTCRASAISSSPETKYLLALRIATRSPHKSSRQLSFGSQNGWTMMEGAPQELFKFVVFVRFLDRGQVSRSSNKVQKAGRLPCCHRFQNLHLLINLFDGFTGFGSR